MQKYQGSQGLTRGPFLIVCLQYLICLKFAPMEGFHIYGVNLTFPKIFKYNMDKYLWAAQSGEKNRIGTGIAMELLQLRYFKMLAESEHLTKTAGKLFISAPSLSATIARLEKELGVQLFDRAGKRLKLNNNGRVFLSHINDMFDNLNNAISSVKKRTDDTVNVAVTSPMGWQEIFLDYIVHHPEISFSAKMITDEDLKNQDSLSEYDFVLAKSSARSFLSPRTWEQVEVAQTYHYLAVYPGHPFAERESIRLIEAKDEGFIVLPKEYSARRYFDDICQAAGFKPVIVAECGYALRSTMLSQKRGIVISGKLIRKNISWYDAVLIPITEPQMQVGQSVFWRKKQELTPQAQQFFDYVREFIKENE